MDDRSFKTIEEVGVSEFKRQLSHFRGSQIRRSQNRPSIPSQGARLYHVAKLFMEGVHFDPAYTPLQHLGYKSVVAGIHSLTARGVQPSEVGFSLGIPNKYSLQMIHELLAGADHVCAEMGISLQTADVTASHHHLVLAVHSLGFAKQEELFQENSIKLNQAICITGDLGGAIAGLRILLREKQFWMEDPSQQFQPDLTAYEYVVGRQLHPAKPTAFLDALKDSMCKTGVMVSVSEGLIPALKEVLSVSDATLKIYAPSIPIALETRKVADEMKEDVDKYAYYGGEDYEFLFTLPQESVQDLQNVYPDISVIGEVTAGNPEIIIHTGEGNEIKIEKG